ncbi:MAG: hypothetical protein EA424_18385 [Planctomycetaceae bacterium]|nr:MAG: hypothetical protein EA424_18385 [Planctomycetaceae bacterium]
MMTGATPGATATGRCTTTGAGTTGTTGRCTTTGAGTTGTTGRCTTIGAAGTTYCPQAQLGNVSTARPAMSETVRKFIVILLRLSRRYRSLLSRSSAKRIPRRVSTVREITDALSAPHPALFPEGRGTSDSYYCFNKAIRTSMMTPLFTA